MAFPLRQYLFEVYKNPHNFSLPRKHLKSAPIQIDDQDDTDSITEFCNIFCTVVDRDRFTLELSGRFPITEEIADLVEIYAGRVDANAGKVTVTLALQQIEVLRDLSDKIRKTAFMGDMVNNPSWLAVSSRTVSSLYRFMRILKEFNRPAASR
ncbi:MAG: hypothetical protein MUF22_03580 [Chitinispirillaceae bacterium]|jgi:hypothetical protein|nr:hypothetical protein [Chitinispirillaceae bacterium]